MKPGKKSVAKIAASGKSPSKSSAKTKAPTTSKAPAKMENSPSTRLKNSSVAYGNLLTPLEDRVLVEIPAQEERTAGGLFIPGTAGTKPNRGTVLAKGRGRRNKKGELRPLDVKVGDQVLFQEFAGTKVVLPNGDALILREEEILGVVV